MLKICVVLFGLSLSSLVTSEEGISSLITKFHQSDYGLKFEWGETIRYNHKLLKHFEFTVSKYNRTTAVANVTAEFNFDVGNDLELIFQDYRFASNEFRLFPLRFQIGFCLALSNNLVGSHLLFKCGNFTGCPMQKGVRYHFCNYAPDGTRLPPFMPSGRYMVEIQAFHKTTEVFFVKTYASIIRPEI